MANNTYWDIPTRLFHWSLVVLVGLQWYTAEEGEMDLHYDLGILLLSLIVFRLLWGLIGPANVRLTQLLYPPHIIIGYVRSLLSSSSNSNTETKAFNGHNPLGGLSVIALLLLLASQSIIGLFANDDILFDGPLRHWVSKDSSDTLTGLHSDLFDLLLIFIGIHLSAVLFYLLARKENLIKPMIITQLEARDSATRVRRWGYVVVGLITFLLCYLAIDSWLGRVY